MVSIAPGTCQRLIRVDGLVLRWRVVGREGKGETGGSLLFVCRAEADTAELALDADAVGVVGG